MRTFSYYHPTRNAGLHLWWGNVSPRFYFKADRYCVGRGFWFRLELRVFAMGFYVWWTP